MAATNRKLFIILTTILTFFILLLNKSNEEWEQTIVRNTRKVTTNWKRLNNRQIGNLSVLGRMLFLEETPPNITDTQTYQILIWKYGKLIENRHLKNFGKENVDPFQDCSVKNCEITYQDEALKTADLVIFHLHRMTANDLPKRPNLQQIWTFLTDESPFHTFLKPNKLEKYNGIFNWSMTYRMDSDIPVPYGRTIYNKSPPEPKIAKRRDVLVAILGSNCGGVNNRWKYVNELQKYIKVDVYGGCGTLKTCPGHFASNCRDIDSYLFYLAFENSNCDEYITEKLWWNAFSKQSIPIVMGASKESYRKLLPPKSYLNIDDYAHPKDLAAHLLYLNSSGKYQDYYEWKNEFQILNEHGYFGSQSYHYCRVCQALNYNQKKPKIYKDLKQFWSVKRDCHPAWNT